MGFVTGKTVYNGLQHFKKSYNLSFTHHSCMDLYAPKGKAELLFKKKTEQNLHMFTKKLLRL